MPQELSLALAVFASTLLSLGYVLQKKGIAWIGFKGRRDRRFYRSLSTWIAGFLLMNLYIVPNAAALRYLEPHIVSAMAGWGVIVLVALSARLLGEAVRPADLAHTLLIVAAIVLLNLADEGGSSDNIGMPALAAASALPFVLGAAGLLRRFARPARAVFFAAASGLSAGMIIVTMKALVVTRGFAIPSYFSSPYLYLYLLFSLAAFLFLQLSYKLGAMMAVGPVQYGAAILYPALCSWAVFENRLNALQWAALLGLVFSVSVLLRGRVRERGSEQDLEPGLKLEK
jgi:drug/metabolite transporter (DMT)-like permease